MSLRLDALGLLVLAALLAGPVIDRLAGAAWPHRAPRAALVLWQAVGLAGGLSILGAGLTLAAADLSPHWLTGTGAVPSHPRRLSLLGWSGAALTALVGSWLVVVLAVSSGRAILARRQHRRGLDLVGEDVGQDVTGRRAASWSGGPTVQLLTHPLPVAYCLPGLRPRIVLSSATLDLLTDAELDAVLAHETAHARGRHDLIVTPFIAWRDTFPFLRSARTALAAVEELVEMLADDCALRGHSAGALEGSLRRLDQVPGRLDEVPADEPRRPVQRRLCRLQSPVRPAGPATPVLAYLGALVLVGLPPLVLILS
jgi:Zn-dependent protease with chaperone function